MTTNGFKPEQGQIYAQTMTYARQLDLEYLRRLKLAINSEIIKRKTLQASKNRKAYSKNEKT